MIFKLRSEWSSPRKERFWVALKGLYSNRPVNISKKWLLYPENIGPFLSIDETALSKGELYTLITNKKAKGKKGALVGIFKGTRAEPIIEQLLKLSVYINIELPHISI